MLRKVLHNAYKLLPYAVIEKRRVNQYDPFIREINNEYQKLKMQRNNVAKEKSTGRGYIFLFWHQGFENAPELVKTCVRSIQKYAEGHEVVLLDKDNYTEWVSMEDYVLEALENHSIGLAHFSDIFRLKLLVEYGGIWIDSTVLLTNPIPTDILHAKLFLFKESTKQDLLLQNRGCVSNWFIVGDKDNDLLFYTLNLILYYVKQHKSFHDYYMFHWILTFVFRDNLCAWEEMPFYPNVMPHYLQFCEYNKPYDIDKWDKIKNISFAHKLSYKLKAEDGSLLSWIIAGMRE